MVKSSNNTTSSKTIVQAIQHNCNISDANFAGNYTLCIYLLKMREYYRWEKKLAFDEHFEKDEMTHWLRNREENWEKIIDDDFQSIQIDDHSFDPFDNTRINQQLEQREMFYHAGIGRASAPHFFIADRLQQQKHGDVTITICGQEYARDLTSPPAMFNGSDIIIRQESLKRVLWERYQEWHWNKYDNPMGKALAHYPFEDSIATALEAMVKVEQNTLIHHEIGEMAIANLIGKNWSKILLNIIGSKAELLARSVRDHLADCQSTLPFLVRQNNSAAIHFYFANLGHLRKQLFPAVMSSYKACAKKSNWHEMTNLFDSAASHWLALLQEITALEPADKKLQHKIINLCESANY